MSRLKALEILKQYDSAPKESHHRVSIEFADPSGRLRAHLEVCANTGFCHQALKKEADSLALAKIREDEIEGESRKQIHCAVDQRFCQS